MAGMVFKVQSMSMEIEDAAELASAMSASTESEQEDSLVPMARVLVVMSIGLILLTTMVCLYAELSMLCSKNSAEASQKSRREIVDGDTIAGTDALSDATTASKGTSPEPLAWALEDLQRNKQLQQLVAAGLLSWADLRAGQCHNKEIIRE